MIKVPDHYCAAMNTSLQIEVAANRSVAVSLCARREDAFPITDSRVFNHPKLIEIRQQNQQTQTFAGKCKECDPRTTHDGERGYNRPSSNERYLKDELLYNQVAPKFMSFKLNMACNLACVACNPTLSTKWRSLEKVKGLPTSGKPDQIRSAIRNIDLSLLETVHMYGGEPLMSNTHEIVLEELAARNKNITIWYDTNGTIIPSEHTLELWSQFHMIRLKFSLDGTEKSFEYQRWPAVWNQVEDNILKMVEILPVNHMLSIRPAMGFLNFHVVKDIRDWYLKNIPTNRLGDPTEFEYNPCYGLYNAGQMPEAMIEEVRELYPENDPIFKLIPPLNTDPTRFTQICESLKRMDRQRGNDWRIALPHLIPWLN